MRLLKNFPKSKYPHMHPSASDSMDDPMQRQLLNPLQVTGVCPVFFSFLSFLFLFVPFSYLLHSPRHLNATQCERENTRDDWAVQVRRLPPTFFYILPHHSPVLELRNSHAKGRPVKMHPFKFRYVASFFFFLFLTSCPP